MRSIRFFWKASLKRGHCDCDLRGGTICTRLRAPTANIFPYKQKLFLLCKVTTVLTMVPRLTQISLTVSRDLRVTLGFAVQSNFISSVMNPFFEWCLDLSVTIVIPLDKEIRISDSKQPFRLLKINLIKLKLRLKQKIDLKNLFFNINYYYLPFLELFFLLYDHRNASYIVF